MRGRKVNREFITSFISECINNSKDTSDDIVREARKNIAFIDKKIIELEELKVLRSNLLDVIYSLEPYSYDDNSSEIKVLNLFKIKKTKGCKRICDQLKSDNNPITLSNDLDIRCIHELELYNVVYRKDGLLYRGDMFDDYMKFIFNEVPSA
jgi:hypothetical protein